jgi:copper chaperone NosL
MSRTALVIAALLGLAACREDVQAERPVPVAMTEETLGHYCQMNLTEHPGPKAQVHLDGLPAPLFFSQVRDAIAYQRMPEQSHRITAVYVSDMGAAESWAEPGAENWIAAEAAYYVVGSAIIGGMGAPELVPFTERSAAEAFVRQHGGTILALAEIDDAEVLAPVEFTLDAEGNFLPPPGHSRH